MRSVFNSIAARIGSGFALMVILLTVAVVVTLQQLASVRQANEQLEEVRMPIVQASVQLLNGVNRSSAALRGWVFMRDSTFINERRLAWEEEIETALSELQNLLTGSVDRTANSRMIELTRVIDVLRSEQQAAEDAPTTRAATTIIMERSAPAYAEARSAISAMVNKQRELMQADLDGINAQTDLLNSLLWALLIIAAGVGSILAIVTTRAIVVPVNKAVEVSDHIAQGHLDTSIQVKGIRELARLGTALTSMRDALATRITQIERHNWLGDAQRRLDDMLRGEKGIAKLATDTIDVLAELTEAQIGAIYMADPNGAHFDLQAGYSINEDIPQRFKVGEGLIGQAAEDHQLRLMTAVDNSHLRVSSSLLNDGPAHILVAPFLIEDQVVGVVELGKFEPFADTQIEFMRSAMHSVAIALHASMNQQKIKDLLEETQRQSEELQVQQEELQQTNEELEEQTQRLKVQQEELQVTNEELEEQTQTVAQRNEALERARKEVERKARELEITGKYKSEFLANMSHELRTPLNSLLILSNHLAKNKGGNLSNDQVESVKVIARSGNDLLNLINDILDLSKVEAGKLELYPSNVPTAVLADEIRTSFTPMAREKDLDLKVHVEENAPGSIRTDHRRLGQVVKNLVSNAIKFTTKGSIKVSLSAHGDGLAITVKDTGIGIPADKQQLIFEAFHQGDGGTSRKYGGTGLGLSISRELAGMLGGRITMESREGAGSTFTLVLPANIPESRNGPADPLPEQEEIAHGTTSIHGAGNGRPATNGAGNAILIIEDDAVFAGVLAEQARSRGFHVLKASTGEEGLDMVRAHRPVAVLLDLDLPGMNGRTVLQRMKNDPLLRHIPVHILSVNERTLEPIRAGAVEYLEKPVSQEQLDEAFQRIEDLVQRKMKNLLIVEDNADQRMAIKQLIGSGDVNFLEAQSAAEGLDLLERFPVDCIVLDIGLPDVSGFELLRLFKEKMGDHLPPIIVYTGRELSEQENDELRMYAETIIVKGIRSEERLLDETALFLHRAVKDLPKPKQDIILDLHDPDAAFQGRTILVVDDDIRNVYALNKVLLEKGCKVLRAENGRDALGMLNRNEPADMVLMDIMMPEMDGYAAMREIRRDPRWKDLPIIALTAKAMKDDRTKCLEAGANDYIAKPIDETRLFSMMRIWMPKKKA